MKVTKRFILRDIMGDYVLVPVGETAKEYPGIITINDTGAFLWERLQEESTEQSLCEALLSEYDVSPEEALEDVRTFTGFLRKAGIVE